MTQDSMFPKHVRVFIGGYLGPSYFIEGQGSQLCYTFSEGYKQGQADIINPNGEDWLLFFNALEKIGVWQWQSEYPNPGVCDGTNWSVEIQWGEKEVVSRGDNNYPGVRGQPSGCLYQRNSSGYFLVPSGNLSEKRNSDRGAKPVASRKLRACEPQRLRTR